MNELLETLNNLTPVLAIVSLALFMTLERWFPYFEHGAHRGRQRWRNVGMIAIGFMINAAVGSHQPETNSHYGCVFSVWDRLFGTAGKADVERLRFGLERFREPGEQTVWQLLKMPFREL